MLESKFFLKRNSILRRAVGSDFFVGSRKMFFFNCRLKLRTRHLSKIKRPILLPLFAFAKIDSWMLEGLPPSFCAFKAAVDILLYSLLLFVCPRIGPNKRENCVAN